MGDRPRRLRSMSAEAHEAAYREHLRASSLAHRLKTPNLLCRSALLALKCEVGARLHKCNIQVIVVFRPIRRPVCTTSTDLEALEPYRPSRCNNSKCLVRSDMDEEDSIKYELTPASRTLRNTHCVRFHHHVRTQSFECLLRTQCSSRLF